jgi:hypothetical protein
MLIVDTRSQMLNFCLETGNAKVAGMAKDLDLVGFRYSIASAVFFVRSLLWV